MLLSGLHFISGYYRDTPVMPPQSTATAKALPQRLPAGPEGSHLAGHWEFPGGKCEEGETPEACLRRELREELDVDASIGDEMFRTRCDYDRPSGPLHLELRFFRCGLNGTERPVQGQEVRWVPRSDLASLRFPPADAELIALLTNP